MWPYMLQGIRGCWEQKATYLDITAGLMEDGYDQGKSLLYTGKALHT